MKKLKSLFKFGSRGFTLIELMVVIVILGILAGLIVPRIMGRPEEAKQLKAKIQIESLETTLKLYKLDNGSYPDTQQGLQALVEKPETGTIPKKWRQGGYLEKGRLPKDPWGNPYQYAFPPANGTGKYPDIWSAGPDGQDGTEDDICSWTTTTVDGEESLGEDLGGELGDELGDGLGGDDLLGSDLGRGMEPEF